VKLWGPEAALPPVSIARLHHSAGHTRQPGSSRPAGGAYGLRIRGVDLLPSDLVEAPVHWPSIELRVRVSQAATPDPEYVDTATARLDVRAGGFVVMDRAAGRVTFTLRASATASALVHPHLAVVGAVWSHWLGRDAFHAGAFVAGDGVWGLLGDKGSGKSSALAALSRSGVPIVCDDVLVLEGATAFAGPRSIDLRAETAQVFGLGQHLGVVGNRERWRVPLGPIRPELPFRGWVALRWAEKPGIRSLRGADRLGELLDHRALRVPPRAPAAMLDLAARPFLELSRPRDWDSTNYVLGLLLDAVSG